RRDLGRPDGDHRHASAWSDAQSRAGLRAIKLGASRENPMDGGFPAVSMCDGHKSVPVKLARLLLYITIGFCFDSHPRIDSVLQKQR
ncbi:MAG: hypothetical protein ACK5GN_13860, partial [Pseudomonadota bacterium]